MKAKTTTPPAVLDAYERFVAEVDQLTDGQYAELTARHTTASVADGYDTAAEAVADVAYDTGRIDGRDRVTGASQGTRDIERLAQAPAPGRIDIALAILTRDLITPEQYTTLTSWASALIPGLDLVEPDQPAPVSPAPAAPEPVKIDRHPVNIDPEPVNLDRFPVNPIAKPAPNAEPKPVPTPPTADPDPLPDWNAATPATGLKLADMFAPGYAPEPADEMPPPARRTRPAEATIAPVGPSWRSTRGWGRPKYRAYWRGRIIRAAAYSTAAVMFPAGPVALGAGLPDLAGLACLLLVACLIVGVVFDIRVRAIARIWAPPHRAARRADNPTPEGTPSR